MSTEPWTRHRLEHLKLDLQDNQLVSGLNQTTLELIDALLRVHALDEISVSYILESKLGWGHEDELPVRLVAEEVLRVVCDEAEEPPW